MSLNHLQREALDQSLVARCQAGETEAFAELVEAYKNEVFTRVYRWVGDKELAEELAQDVFLKAFRSLKKFRSDAKFSTWLFQISLNCCRDFWRSQRRHQLKKHRLQEAQRQEGEVVYTSKQDADLAEDFSKLYVGLNKLPASYQEVLKMRYLLEMPHAEIAEQLGEKLSSIKMRSLRGLLKLRKILEKLHVGSK